MSRSKRWCFTINNYNDDDQKNILEWQTQYLVFGREVGESGTPHLQGFVTFKQAQRLAGVKKLHQRAHWEVARGTSAEAADYCKKDGDYEERGQVPSQGKRTDLDDTIHTLKEKGLKQAALEHPATFVKYSRGLTQLSLYYAKPYDHDDVRGIWIYGPPGTGKSRWARDTYQNIYLKQQNKWWDGYNGEDIVLLDDLDTETLGHHLKIWSDRYACTGETKGGTINLTHKVFIVTSNYHPSDLFKDVKMYEAIERRFNIQEKLSLDQPLNI